jgi:peptide-methionine (S)-S-oxide reductase
LNPLKIISRFPRENRKNEQRKYKTSFEFWLFPSPTPSSPYRIYKTFHSAFCYLYTSQITKLKNMMNRWFKKVSFVLSIMLGFVHFSCGNATNTKNTMEESQNSSSAKLDTVTLGAGCFWCVEAVYQRLKGVKSVTSGYMGGKMKNPSYRDICTGLTGHAEVCQLTYDPKIISFDTILEVFWQTHDPTTLNRQGADVGTQYRSAIFFHNEAQKDIANAWKVKLNTQKVFPKAIVTEIGEASVFYTAEDYHQNYFNQNGDQPYCQIVIKPKMDKFLKSFKEKLN